MKRTLKFFAVEFVAVAVIWLLYVCALQGQTMVADKSESPQCRAVAKITLPKWTGSGTLIGIKDDKGIVLSCRHVNPRLGMVVKLEWLAAENQVTSGKVIDVVHRFHRRGMSQFQTDLALVETELPRDVTPMYVARFDPDNGPWTSIGCRRDRMYQSIADEGREEGSMLIFNSGYLKGNSGGATYDKYGRIVGVIVASGDDNTFGISADGEELRKLLEKHGLPYLND